MTRRTGIVVVVATVLACGLPAAVAADGEPPQRRTTATRTARAPRIDGRLDDAVWQAAAPQREFRQRSPDEDRPATEPTEFLMLYDDRAIYIGIRSDDRTTPDARLGRRDRSVGDWVELALDSSGDRTSAFVFRVTAAGGQYDARLFDDTQEDPTWDAVWRSEVKRDDRGWTAELEIPLSTLRFGTAVTSWGFQVRRFLSRRNETMEWQYVPSTVEARVSRFGVLAGLDGLRPARLIELRPFGITRLESVRGGAGGGRETTPSIDGGLDAKLGLTSDLVLDLTVNPDFGQVEADPEVLNLSRFELEFPEKRPFFSERNDIFAMPIQQFYSRRIGEPLGAVARGDAVGGDAGDPLLARRDSERPRLYGAARMTGRAVGDLALGLVAAAVGPEAVDAEASAGPAEVTLAPARLYGVARARYDFGAASYLGATGTLLHRLSGDGVDPLTGREQASYGVDGQWQSSSGSWRALGQLVVSQPIGPQRLLSDDGRPCAVQAPDCTPARRIDGTVLGSAGFGVSSKLSRITDHAILVLDGALFSPTLDLDGVGFLNEFGKARGRALAAYRNTRAEGRIYRNFGVGAFAEAHVDHRQVSLERLVGLDHVAELQNDWSIDIIPTLRLPGTWDTYETLDGTPFERPASANLEIDWTTNRQRSLALALVHKSYANLRDPGWGASLAATVTLQPIAWLELSLGPSLDWNDGALRFVDCSADDGERCVSSSASRTYRFASLDAGSLSWTGRAGVAFRPDLSFDLYAQLFFAQGDYRRYQAASVLGAERLERSAFTPLAATPEEIAALDDALDFATAALNVNAVLRWEFRRGSSLYTVYTRRQSNDGLALESFPAIHPSRLGGGPAVDTLMLKLQLFWRGG